MSRSSKGFADFFPTAPSVLQQKRSKASQDRKTHCSPPIGRQHNTTLPSTAPGPSSRNSDGSVFASSLADGNLETMPQVLKREESECANGDISHEVGSASSTSTASSIFSAGQREVNNAYQNGLHKSTTLTPLTNIDSSPRAIGLNGSPKRISHDQYLLPTHPLKSPSSPPLSDTTTSGVKSASHLRRPQARPGNGEIKGFKAIYDPDLDRALRGKEKKGRQAQYQPFGEEVCAASLGISSS